jgi:hypothetical protein
MDGSKGNISQEHSRGPTIIRADCPPFPCILRSSCALGTLYAAYFNQIGALYSVRSPVFFLRSIGLSPEGHYLDMNDLWRRSKLRERSKPMANWGTSVFGWEKRMTKLSGQKHAQRLNGPIVATR